MVNQGSITSMEAFEHLGITRLAARIADLKKQGIKIDGETIEVKTRFGQIAKVKRYWVVE